MDIAASPVTYALLAGMFTWGMTAIGAASVYCKHNFSQRLLDIMLGFAGGVMIAASFWSLLAPAIELSAGWGKFAFFPAAAGFLAGGMVLRGFDYVLPHLHPCRNEQEGVATCLPRSFLLIFAITLHNFPEGLAVGVAFGGQGHDGASLMAAFGLALGIGLQNLPEGLAVSVPLMREGMSRHKAFFYGQLSGIVEPIGAVLGALVVSVAAPVLPFALAFAAGAMIFVVVEEVIPESHASGNGNAATMGTIGGFTIMMILDVALG